MHIKWYGRKEMYCYIASMCKSTMLSIASLFRQSIGTKNERQNHDGITATQNVSPNNMIHSTYMYIVYPTCLYCICAECMNVCVCDLYILRRVVMYT